MGTIWTLGINPLETLKESFEDIEKRNKEILINGSQKLKPKVAVNNDNTNRNVETVRFEPQEIQRQGPNENQLVDENATSSAKGFFRDSDDDLEEIAIGECIDLNELDKKVNALSLSIREGLQRNENVDELKKERRKLWDEIERLEEQSKGKTVIDESISRGPGVFERLECEPEHEASEIIEAISEEDELISQMYPTNCSVSLDDSIRQRMNEINMRVFHHRTFRGVQSDAIAAALNGEDVFVLMPTGGGKSLCYQLPGCFEESGVTVVVSPLLALMRDQVRALQDLGIEAKALTGDTERADYIQICKEMKQGILRFVYVTPEKLAKSEHFMGVLQDLKDKLVRFAIDEAHCVSQWGHDFRPDYVRLSILRRTFPQVPIMALTATATSLVKSDVIRILELRNCRVLQQSFNRPNLNYEVKELPPGPERQCKEIMKWIENHGYRNATGIVFCVSVKDTEKMAELLQKNGLNCEHYHAKLGVSQRNDVQRRWMDGTTKVMVATLAFGLGIDKSDVRFVIHHRMPKSLEQYYQESGRAGRDGRVSHCLLLHGKGDKMKLLRIMALDRSRSKEQVQKGEELVGKMEDYANERIKCRRALLLEYFGEHFDRKDCHQTCDNCKELQGGKVRIFQKDYTDHAKNLASLITRISGHRKGSPFLQASYVEQLYAGKPTAAMKNCGDVKMPETGLGNIDKMPKGRVSEILKVLCNKQVLKVVRKTFARGQSAPLECLVPLKTLEWIQSPSFPQIFLDEVANDSTDELTPVTQEGGSLYETILSYRDRWARETGIPPQEILSPDAIRRLCVEKPTDLSALKEIIGPLATNYSFVSQELAHVFGQSVDSVQVSHSPYFSSGKAGTPATRGQEARNKSTANQSRPSMPQKLVLQESAPVRPAPPLQEAVLAQQVPAQTSSTPPTQGSQNVIAPAPLTQGIATTATLSAADVETLLPTLKKLIINVVKDMGQSSSTDPK